MMADPQMAPTRPITVLTSLCQIKETINLEVLEREGSGTWVQPQVFFPYSKVGFPFHHDTGRDGNIIRYTPFCYYLPLIDHIPAYYLTVTMRHSYPGNF